MPLPAKDPVQLTHARLRGLLEYDPDTGVFTWLVDRNGTTRAGSRAGHARPDGYRAVYVDGRHVLEHRLAVFWMEARWPEAYVDHVNGDRADNSWTNLRECTHKENMRYRDTGVRYDPDRGRWLAGLSVSVETEEAARAMRAALEAARDAAERGDY